MTTSTKSWVPLWRAHEKAGRATSCGYETALNVCNRPNIAGTQIMDCLRCEAGTQQNRYARLVTLQLQRSRQ